MGIMGDKVPASTDVGLFKVASLAEEARRGGGAALWRGRPAPFPIGFSIGELVGEAELCNLAIVVGFDRVGYNDFTSEVRAVGVFVESGDMLCYVVDAGFVDDG